MLIPLTTSKLFSSPAKRLPDGPPVPLPRGSFQRQWIEYDGNPRWQWLLYPPGGVVGVLSATHTVKREEDLTTSVAPSVLQPGVWHGWLVKNLWITVTHSGEVPFPGDVKLEERLCITEGDWYLPVKFEDKFIHIETWKCMPNQVGELIGVYIPGGDNEHPGISLRDTWLETRHS